MGGIVAFEADRPVQLSGFELAADTYESMVLRLQGAEAMRMTEDDLEDLLFKEGNELLRQLMQAHLDARQGGKVPGGKVEGADGIVRDNVRELPRNLETRFGTVVVNRTGYAAPEAKSLVPMDAALNLPEQKASFTLQRMVAEEAAKGSFDNVVQTIETRTGGHVAKRQAESLAVDAAVDFGDFYRARHLQAVQNASETGSIVVISGDGVGVRVLARARRDKKLQVAKVKHSGLLQRLAPGEKPGQARMAEVAAVYTIKPYVRDALDVLGEGEASRKQRPRPEYKRVWASLVEGAEQVLASAFDEALYRDPGRKKRWVALVDGNAHQIAVISELARIHGIKVTIIVDIYHVAEYVWKAAHVFHPDDAPARNAWVRERLLAILEGNCSHVAAGMRRSATLQNIPKAARKPVDECARYLLNKKAYLRYHEYLAAGLPCGTGVIEGTGRHLVNDRMDIAGAHWGLETGEAVLQLRALRSSEDFDEYWKFHLSCEHTRNHSTHYKNQSAPSPVLPSSDSSETTKTAARTPLRLVPS